MDFRGLYVRWEGVRVGTGRYIEHCRRGVHVVSGPGLKVYLSLKDLTSLGLKDNTAVCLSKAENMCLVK